MRKQISTDAHFMKHTFVCTLGCQNDIVLVDKRDGVLK